MLFTRIAFAAVPAAAANVDIYLAVRTDAKPGSGIQQDPFDAGSAQKYDALLARFTSNTTFHYAPGTYATTGWHYRRAQTARPGCIHLGAGIDQTIVQLVGATTAPDGVIFAVDYDGTCDGFQVQNMTLDVNAPQNPMWSGATGAFGAINLQGNNVLISGCKIMNFGTSRPGAECFPVFIYPGVAFAGRTFNNIQVQNCTFTNPAKGNRDGLSGCVIGSDNTVNLTNAAISGCSFLDIASDFTYSHAFSANLVQNNFVKGCSTGFYREPDQVEKPAMAVLNNTFIDVTVAAQINFHATGGFGSLTFSGNKVVLRDQYNCWSAAVNVTNMDQQGSVPVMQSLTMTNNQIIGIGQNPLSTPAYRAIDLRCPANNLAIKSVVIQGNSLGSSIPNGFEFDVTRSNTAMPNLQYGVNRYANGQPVPVEREM
jgi:hypothetical protein